MRPWCLRRGGGGRASQALVFPAEGMAQLTSVRPPVACGRLEQKAAGSCERLAVAASYAWGGCLVGLLLILGLACSASIPTLPVEELYLFKAVASFAGGALRQGHLRRLCQLIAGQRLGSFDLQFATERANLPLAILSAKPCVGERLGLYTRCLYWQCAAQFCFTARGGDNCVKLRKSLFRGNRSHCTPHLLFVRVSKLNHSGPGRRV